MTKSDIDDDFPSYGVSNTYLGEHGEDYFRRQDASGLLASKYNKFIFKPFICEHDDVLDFGCGGGHLLNALEARTKAGVEINPAARKKAAQSGIVTYGSLAEISGQAFTRIVTSHALEHIPNPHQALVELSRLLTPDGLLLWLSPMDDCHARHQRRWNRDDFDNHLYTWTPLLMGNLLRAAGYSPQTIRIVAHAFPPATIGRTLWAMNEGLFHLAARLWATLRKQRQIFAVASRDNVLPAVSDRANL